jgi:hypothetical protein
MRWKYEVTINVRRWIGNVGGNYNSLRIVSKGKLWYWKCRKVGGHLPHCDLVIWSVLRLFIPGGLRPSWSVQAFLPLLLPIRLCKATVPPIRHPLINIDTVPGCWLLLSIYPSLLYYLLLPSSLHFREKNKTNRSCWNGGEECSEQRTAAKLSDVLKFPERLFLTFRLHS